MLFLRRGMLSCLWAEAHFRWEIRRLPALGLRWLDEARFRGWWEGVRSARVMAEAWAWMREEQQRWVVREMPREWLQEEALLEAICQGSPAALEALLAREEEPGVPERCLVLAAALVYREFRTRGDSEPELLGRIHSLDALSRLLEAFAQADRDPGAEVWDRVFSLLRPPGDQDFQAETPAWPISAVPREELRRARQQIFPVLVPHGPARRTPWRNLWFVPFSRERLARLRGLQGRHLQLLVEMLEEAPERAEYYFHLARHPGVDEQVWLRLLRAGMEVERLREPALMYPERLRGGEIRQHLEAVGLPEFCLALCLSASGEEFARRFREVALHSARDAARVLAELEEERAVLLTPAALQPLLEHPEAHVRLLAIRWVGRVGREPTRFFASAAGSA